MIDFSEELKGLDGQTLMEAGKDGKTEPLTLRSVSVFALIMAYEDERNLAATTKFERGLLAQRIHSAKKPMKLKADEVKTVKDLVGKAFGAMVVLAAWPLLDPAERRSDEAEAA